MTEETKNTMQRYGELYGPYAFGVVSLLVLWYAIVKPELDGRTVDMEAQREIVSAMKEQSNSMQITATILERTVERLTASK